MLFGVIVIVVLALPLNVPIGSVPLPFTVKVLCVCPEIAAPMLLGVILTVLLVLPLKVFILTPFPCIVKVPVVLAACVATPPALEEPA